MDGLFFHRIKPQDGTPNGSDYFKLLPEHLQKLDLLVRESIQNSLDAADKAQTDHLAPNGYVDVCFHTGKMESRELIDILPEIQEKLEAKFQTDNEYIVVRDYRTVGLSGAVIRTEQELDDKGNPIYSNYWKLIRDISKNQTVLGAGGSHGVGKTVYSMIGAGIVIYYSRFRDNDSDFSSRLVICLVEDERKTDALLSPGRNEYAGGLAHWGKRSADGDLLPLTEEKEINKILNYFQVEPYDGQQTGTCVIIPFVNSSSLLADARNGFPDENSCSDWTSNIEAYLKLSVQRWYAPRLANKAFPDLPYLNIFINNNPVIQPDQMLPLFKTIQDLYNSAFAVLSGKRAEESNSSDIHVEQLPALRNRNTELFRPGQSSPGVLAYVETSDNLDSLFNLVPDLRSENHRIIAAYTRKPGMIVKYQDPFWIQKMTGIKIPENKYCIVLFVPRSSMPLGNIYRELENYLRDCEGADHSGWNDRNDGAGVIEKIWNGAGSILKRAYESPGFAPDLMVDEKYASAMTKFWFSAEGFGKKPTGGTRSPVDSGKKKDRMKAGLKLLDKKIQDGNIILTYQCIWISLQTKVELFVAKDGTGSGCSRDKWIAETGSAFPLHLVDAKKAQHLWKTAGRGAFEYCKTEDAVLKMTRSENLLELQIEALDEKMYSAYTFKTELTLTIRTDNPKYKVNVELKQPELAKERDDE